MGLHAAKGRGSQKIKRIRNPNQQTGSINVIVGGMQQKIKLEVSDVYTETGMIHSSGSATGTQEQIKQSELKPDEYASTYVATAWDRDDVSILEESSAPSRQ